MPQRDGLTTGKAYGAPRIDVVERTRKRHYTHANGHAIDITFERRGAE